MPDFAQTGPVTTLHDLGTQSRDALEAMLREATANNKLGLVLPVTASDMRADPFPRIMRELVDADYIDSIVVTLGIAPDEADYRQAKELIAPLGSRAEVLWLDSPRISALYEELSSAGLNLGQQGKGQAVWTAFGYLLSDPSLKAFVLHDCDIVNYDRILLARLCLPMAHPGLDFEFCKAFYARCTDRMHGRVVRLLVLPLIQSLITVFGQDRFLTYLSCFRYPLAGEFAVTSTLARSNRIPSDWGLEVGTLAEVFRNTSSKRVCQVDLCFPYDHKHQNLSAGDPNKGLMKMATEILTSLFRTLASRGVVFGAAKFATLRSAYLRTAQNAIRQYHADSLINGLVFDRHAEEQAIEGFSQRITVAGQTFLDDPLGGEPIPNWTRVLTAFPEFPQRLRQAAVEDAKHLG